MWRVLAVVFIVVTLEVLLLARLAQWITFWPTLGVVVVTGLIGVLSARVQGWLVWQKIQLDLHHGTLPADGLIDGILLLAAGLLLFTPGLLTDAAGFVLLVPSVRESLREWLKRKFREMIERGQTTVFIIRQDPP